LWFYRTDNFLNNAIYGEQLFRFFCGEKDCHKKSTTKLPRNGGVMFPSSPRKVAMKLDLDPDENQKQLNKLVSFHNKYSVMYSPWFWYFFGSVFFIGGVVTLIVPELLSESGSSSLGKTESSLLFVAIGATMFIACKAVVSIASRLREYEPKENKGNEWEL
jgi:hypothetical protein